jgi:predicted nucleic acid-binding Zn ribbon protein
MILTPIEHDMPYQDVDAAELLIKEARQKARRRRFRISTVLAVSLVVVVVALLLHTSGGVSSNSKRPTGSKAARSSGANLSSVIVPHFDQPDAIAVIGTNVWVVNEVGNSITEFNAQTGSQVRVIDAKADAFHHPDGIAVQGARVWVTNSNENLGMGGGNYDTARYSSVTELNAKNGSLVRVIDAKADGLLEPGPIAVSGSHVWVLNKNARSFSPSTPGNALIELNVSTGSLVHVFKTNVDGLYEPFSITASRSDVWVTSEGGLVNSVTEVNSSTGSLVRIIKSTAGQLGVPYSMAVSAGHVWITNLHDNFNDNDTGHSIAEIDAANGSITRVVDTTADRTSGYLGIAVAGSHVWLTNDGRLNNSVTELNASDGSLVQIIRSRADKFNEPTGIVASGNHVWVLNTNSVTELNVSDGSLVRVVK